VTRRSVDSNMILTILLIDSAPVPVFNGAMFTDVVVWIALGLSALALITALVRR
jgi:hypothetical protein